ncbi:hypothetical protein ES705_23177 [subsurface metagenome]
MPKTLGIIIPFIFIIVFVKASLFLLSEIIILEICKPAILNVLPGEVHTNVLCSNSLDMVENKVCLYPESIKS